MKKSKYSNNVISLEKYRIKREKEKKKKMTENQPEVFRLKTEANINFSALENFPRGRCQPPKEFLGFRRDDLAFYDYLGGDESQIDEHIMDEIEELNAMSELKMYEDQKRLDNLDLDELFRSILDSSRLVDTSKL